VALERAARLAEDSIQEYTTTRVTYSAFASAGTLFIGTLGNNISEVLRILVSRYVIVDKRFT